MYNVKHVEKLRYLMRDIMTPKIYLFFNNIGDGDGEAFAISEDGTILGTHICSSEVFVAWDLKYRKTYDEYYPNGYSLEFVPVRDLTIHQGLNAALIACNERRNPKIIK